MGKLKCAVIGVAVAAVICGGLFARAEAAGTKIVMEGSTTVGPIAKAFAEYYMDQNKGVQIMVGESGSGNGAKALVRGDCDIANTSRPMKPKEFQAAVEKGIYPVAHVVALDGIAIIVSPSNPVGKLTMDKIKAIYKGEITNWKDVGGRDMEIVRVSRDSSSGTFETFHNLVMKKEKMVTGTERVASNTDARQRVRNNKAAIAYVGLGYVDNTVKACKVNGILPSKGTVRSGQYPISRPLFMWTNGYPKLGSHVYRVVTLHLSKNGQRIVEAVGFIPATNY
ncbi:MAG: PstS family phosphate ABC transporter substrate-binding protein [Planctomycetota bacterium]